MTTADDGVGAFAALCDGHARRAGSPDHKRKVRKMAERIALLNGDKPENWFAYARKAHGVLNHSAFNRERETQEQLAAFAEEARREDGTVDGLALLDARLGALGGDTAPKATPPEGEAPEGPGGDRGKPDGRLDALAGFYGAND